MIWWLVLTAAAGWAFDDFCGTPPRKPWPGPGPWWMRKALAAVGGIVMWKLVGPQLGEDAASVLSAVLLGGVGGVVLASIGQSVMGKEG